MSNNSNPYTSRKVNTLAPTDGIKDAQVRAFCDSLSNVWQLRNGNIGPDDSERFITKQEWDYLAKNPNIRALAGIGQPGSSTNEPGPGDGTSQPPIPDWINNLVQFLNAGVTLYDFTQIRRTSNELFASIYALTSDMRNQIALTTEEFEKLNNDITEINTIEETSTSRSATHLWALKEQVNDPDTGLPVAMAGVIEIDKVGVNQVTRSANAQQTKLITAIVQDPLHGNLQNRADIIEINKVEVTSTSANAKQLSGLSATLGYDKVTGQSKVTADIAQLNWVDVNSDSANAKQTAGMLATFANPTTTSIAAINAINEISATSTSASARQLSGAVAMVGVKARVFVQQAVPPGDSPPGLGPGASAPVGIVYYNTPQQYILKDADIWLNTSFNNKMMVWKDASKQWVDGSDARVGAAMGGVQTETDIRVASDNALVTQLNAFWAQVGNSQALVVGGPKVEITPDKVTASKFNQVQSALYVPGTETVMASAVTRDEHKTFVDKQKGIADATYSLQVDARANGQHAVGGMSITAHVEPGKTPESVIVFMADKLYIVEPDIPDVKFAPFSVQRGIVRINVARIQNYIQSDTFFPPGQGGHVEGFGWKIEDNGTAQFYGTTTLARVVSGSRMVDRNSGAIMSTTAVGGWTSAYENGGAQVISNSRLKFYGPDLHGQTDEYHRIRSSENGIALATNILFTGVADHKVTLWWSYRGGGWNSLQMSVTPTSGENATSCGWAGTFTCERNGYYEFGVSATGWSLSDNNGYTQLKDFMLSATMSNM